MPRDAIETVRRLRSRAVDEARRQLAEGMALATEADAQARAAERCIEHEAERASDPAGDDSLVEAFASWLPGARHRAATARAMVERHEAEVARRRAELAASRVALATIDALVQQRRAAADLSEGRAAQRAMDDAARRAPDPSGSAAWKPR